MSAQIDLYDAQTRHHIDVQRVAAGDVKRTLSVLRKSDKELTAKIASRVNPGDFTSTRYKEMLADIRSTRLEMMKQLANSNRDDLRVLAKTEQDAMAKMFSDAVPVRLDYATADMAKLNSMLVDHPFAAGGAAAPRTLEQWWSGLASADATRITSALQYGLVQGETIAQITKRVVDATDMTRRNAEAVVRTGVNHASNGAREEFFKANKGVIQCLMWCSTLDGRTTEICMAYDGSYAPLDTDKWDGVPQPHLETPYTRPPAHVQCRSYMVAVLSADGIAQTMPDRPFVRDARTREWREKDFRAEAKAKAGAGWKGMTAKERNGAIKDIRTAWTRENVGQVPGKTTYSEWLAKQPAKFQNETLGLKKAELFRSGTPLDKFVDRKGGELSLKQLRADASVPALPAPVAVRDYGGMDGAAVEQLAAKEQAEWVASRLGGSITDDSWEAVGAYQGQEFEPINGALREGRWPAGSPGDTTAMIDQAFVDSHGLGVRQVVYRTSYLDEETAQSLLGGTTPKAGVEFIDRGFISTSLKKDIWEYGVGDEQYFKGAVYNFKIEVPQDFGALRLPDYNGEAEIMLNRDTKFRLVEVVRVEKRSIFISDGVLDAELKVPVFEIRLEIVR